METMMVTPTAEMVRAWVDGGSKYCPGVLAWSEATGAPPGSLQINGYHAGLGVPGGRYCAHRCDAWVKNVDLLRTSRHRAIILQYPTPIAFMVPAP